jgi:hypothetical protein
VLKVLAKLLGGGEVVVPDYLFQAFIYRAAWGLLVNRLVLVVDRDASGGDRD